MNVTDPPTYEDNLAVQVTAGIIITIVSLMTFFGNIFNLLVLNRTEGLHKNPGFFMMSLAVADLGAGIINITTSLPSVYLNYWPFPKEICELTGFLAAWFYTVSIYTLTAVSIDRYLAISKPLRYHGLFPKNYCFVCITVVWIISSFIFLVPFFGYGAYEYKNTRYICMCGFTTHIWLTMAADFLIIIPCTLITSYAYLRIYLISRRHQKEIKNQVYNQGVATRGAKLKALRTISITVLAFYLSWLPFTVQQTTLLFSPGLETPPVWDFIINWIAIGNSFMNCIIYSTTNKVFRESGQELMRNIFCPCRERVHPISGADSFDRRPRKSRIVSVI